MDFAFSCSIIPRLLHVHIYGYRNGDFSVGGTEYHVGLSEPRKVTDSLLMILDSTGCSGLLALDHVAWTETIPSASALCLQPQGTTLWDRYWHFSEVPPKCFRAEVCSKYSFRIFTLVCSALWFWTMKTLNTTGAGDRSFWVMKGRRWMSTVWTQFLVEHMQWFNFWELLLCLKKGLMQTYVGGCEKGSGGKCSKQNVTREVKMNICFQTVQHWRILVSSLLLVQSLLNFSKELSLICVFQ